MRRKDESVNLWALFDIPGIDQGGVSSYLHSILQKCSEWFGASVASVFVADEQGKIRCQAAIGVQISEEATIEEGKGIAGSALLHGAAMLVEDPAQNPLIANQVKRTREDIGSAMVIPLISNGRKLGVLNLAKAISDHPFNEKDLARANTLASHISLAVANWRMIGELQNAHEQVRSVFNLLGVAVFVVQDGHIIKRNPEAERLVGNLSFNELLKDLPESLSKGIESTVKQAELFQKVKIQLAHQDTHWTVSAAPMPTWGVVLMIEDVSHTVHNTQELSRVKRLAEIGQMSAAIAHEIRNPLTGIRSAAQMIAIAPEQGEAIAEMIEEEVLKLNELCTQFLDFARPTDLILTKTNLSEIAERLASVHAQEFESAGVKLITETAPSNFARLDRNKLEQVMRNLLLNALQASEPGGTVVLKTNQEGFLVQDDGHGMDFETMSKLFMPFFTTKAKGTGLGLSTCRKIVEAHGGTIQVHSEVGKGTQFSVRFADNSEVAA